jgi:serine/threonine protein kinase
MLLQFTDLEVETIAREREQPVGSFVLLERIASGGLGEVWKARDTRLNRVVALKFILAGKERASAKDLLREARAASALTHPNIVTILEIGEAGGDAYIAMEFIDGKTLRARMTGPVSLDESVRIASQVCLGLGAAHAHGIVHRDLKPENIMVRVDNFVKLVDFGLAKVLPWSGAGGDAPTEASITERGQIAGTLAYMSPEQARGQRVETPSDIFSFGIILYELIAGQHPFRADTPMDTLNAIMTRPHVPIVKVRPEVPVGISDLLDRCLSKEPSARFGNAKEITERLNPSVIGIRPELPPASGQRRHRLPVKAGVAAVVLVLLLAIFILRPMFFHSASAPTSIRSVAVMNLKVPPTDASETAFSQDLVQGLAGALLERGLRVAARSTVGGLDPSTDARSLGQKLNVDAVLQGELRTSSSNIRLYFELVDARTGFVVWSRTTPIDLTATSTSGEETAARLADLIAAAAKGQQ